MDMLFYWELCVQFCFKKMPTLLCVDNRIMNQAMQSYSNKHIGGGGKKRVCKTYPNILGTACTLLYPVASPYDGENLPIHLG